MLTLIILDGWGIGPKGKGNAITEANTPNMNSFIKNYPNTQLKASGEAVGLPAGEDGNSEVGHIHIGLGSILMQELPRINNLIKTKEFFRNKAFLKAIAQVKKNNSSLHITGLCSRGHVHSSLDHLFALLKLAKINKLKKVFIHAILDGRDTKKDDGLSFIREIEKFTKKEKIGKIASISGRFYAMDRDTNWERTKKAYDAIALGAGETGEDPEKIILASYKNKIYDEEFIPTIITENNQPIAKIAENDALIFFNYRSDRAKQLTKIFTEPNKKLYGPGMPGPYKKIQNLCFVAFAPYKNRLKAEIAFSPAKIKNTLGEIIAKNNLKQLRLAETEKYAHVTYFFSGKKEKKFKGEDRQLIPSPKVINYAQKPKMSAPEITDFLLKQLQKQKYDFILVNFANADMVGHTGNLQASIAAIEYLDECLGKISKAILSQNGTMIISADHGNAELVYNTKTKQIDKKHSANPVPFIIINNSFKNLKIKKSGQLTDIAPTILKLMKIKQPKAMQGRPLI